MEENTSLWNKKVSDLTVGDSVKANVLAPVIAAVAVTVATTVVAGVGSGIKAFREKRKNRQNETTEQ